MEITLFDEHVLAEADNVKGDETSELLAGLLTVTPANAGNDNANRATQVKVACLTIFIGNPYSIEALLRSSSPSAS
jgi:hypothetical protein